ncbi:MAG: hypothetical protein N2044_09695 [Cyclobacteriaceae bacterium]|nr:hypothetical protein [Cyclobacteriaceae bacterium]
MAGKSNTFRFDKILFQAFILFVIMSGFKCQEEKMPQFEDFVFVIPVVINPSDSIVLLNDTIWFIGNFPDTLFELNSGEYFKIQKPTLVASLIARRLIGSEFSYSQQPGAIPSFDFVSRVGGVSNPGQSFATLTFIWSEKHYKCRFGIKPKQRGIFTINILNPEQFDLSEINLGLTSDGRQRIPVYRNIYFVVNNGKTNFELFQKHCKAASLDYPTEQNIYYEQKGTFTFRVVE